MSLSQGSLSQGSLTQNSAIYQDLKEETARKLRGYGFIAALICVAVALVAVSAVLTPATIGAGIDATTWFAGP